MRPSSTSSVAHDDGTRDTWMAAQHDAYVPELDEADPVFDLACDLADNEGIPFAEAMQQAAYQYTPLTTRRCHDERYWLMREIQGAEHISKIEAERMAVQLISSGTLAAYRDDWDAMAYKAGNPAGLPF